MKRATILLGTLVSMIFGFLFAAPAVQAQTPLDTISNGGVTCKQYATTYDWQTAATDTFWDCINTSSPPTSFEKLVPRKAKDLPSAMKTTLADVEIMIFQNRSDFASFTGETAPAPKYMAWAAPDGPSGTSLSSKRIAAVFAEASLWSTADDQVATRNITALYDVNVMQAIGRHYDQLTGNPSQLSSSPVHLFANAVVYDQFWADREDIEQVWDSDIKAAYPNLDTPWQILDELYGGHFADIYAFQFAQEFSSNYGHLNGFINSWLKETTGYRFHEIFMHPSPSRPVSGTYIPANLITGAPGIAVLCVEYELSAYDAPADILYDCVRPYNSTYGGQRQSGQGIDALEPVLKNELSSNHVKLYIMIDIDHHQAYHLGTSSPQPLATNAWGFSTGVDSGSNRASSAFWRAWTKADRSEFVTTPGNYYNTTLVHEVGHQLDGIWNRISGKQGSNFATAVFDDLSHIDSSAVTCLDMFTQIECNHPASFSQTYSTIFAGISNPDSQTCTDILSSEVCSLPGTNTDKFNTYPDRDEQHCDKVFSSSICQNADRVGNSVIMSRVWSIDPQELWSYAFQVTAPAPAPNILERAMDDMSNLTGYMETNPDVHSNGEPSVP